MSDKKTLKEQFSAIRPGKTGETGRPTTPNEQEQDIIDTPVTQPEAAKLNPHGGADKQSGEQMRTSLTIARTEQRNNENELETIKRRATASQTQQNRSIFSRIAT